MGYTYQIDSELEKYELGVKKLLLITELNQLRKTSIIRMMIACNLPSIALHEDKKIPI